MSCIVDPDDGEPLTIGDCRESVPDGRCGVVRCRLNLMADVLPTGSLLLVKPGRATDKRRLKTVGPQARGKRASCTMPEKGSRGRRALALFDEAADALVDYWTESGLPTCIDWWTRAQPAEVVALLGGAERLNEYGLTLEQVGKLMVITRERARQIEVRGLLILKMSSPSPAELGIDLHEARQVVADDDEATAATTGDGQALDATGEIADEIGAASGVGGVGDSGDDSGEAPLVAQAVEMP